MQTKLDLMKLNPGLGAFYLKLPGPGWGDFSHMVSNTIQAYSHYSVSAAMHLYQKHTRIKYIKTMRNRNNWRRINSPSLNA